jgi:hypothetical protein
MAMEEALPQGTGAEILSEKGERLSPLQSHEILALATMKNAAKMRYVE